MASGGDVLLVLLKRLAGAEGVEDPSPLLLKRVMRILGSSISGTRPDAQATASAIKAGLVQSDGSGTQAALRFSELHQRVLALGATRQTTSILHLLSELGDAQTPAPPVVRSSFAAPVLNLASLGSSQGPPFDDAYSSLGRSSQRGGYSQHGGYSQYGGGPPSPSPSFDARSERSQVPSLRQSHPGLLAAAVSEQMTEQELLRDVLFAFQVRWHGGWGGLGAGAGGGTGGRGAPGLRPLCVLCGVSGTPFRHAGGQGIDGTHIKFSTELDTFVLNPALHLPPATRDLVAQVNRGREPRGRETKGAWVVPMHRPFLTASSFSALPCVFARAI
jgi:hypothetical protein